MRTLPPTNMEQLLRDIVKRLLKLEGQLGALARDKTYPSTQRPDALGRAGARIFDVTLGKPLWSDGSRWVDATGTPA